MKKDLIKLIEKYSYGEWRNGNFDHMAGFENMEYPEFLAQVICDHFRLEKINLSTRNGKRT